MKELRKLIIVILLFLLIAAPSLYRAFRPMSKNVLRIAVQSPLSGEQAAQGDTLCKGAHMAVNDHKSIFKKMGYSLEIICKDDQKNAVKGINNAIQLAMDKSVVAVVGHLNTNISIASANVYSKNRLSLVSPANTGNEFTNLGFDVINRIPPSDDQQAHALAATAYKKLNLKNAIVIQDKTPYGDGLGASFKNSFEAAGNNVLAYEGIISGEKDLSGVINAVMRVANNKVNELKKSNSYASTKDIAIMFGGSYPDFVNLYKQARSKGFEGPFLGGDGIASQEFVKNLGDVRLYDVFYSSIADEIGKQSKGKEWIKRFKDHFKSDTEEVTYNAYLAAVYPIKVLYSILNQQINEDGCPIKGKSEKPADAFLANGAFNRPLMVKAIRCFGLLKDIGADVQFDKYGNNIHAKVFIYKFGKNHYPGDLVYKFDPDGRIVEGGI